MITEQSSTTPTILLVEDSMAHARLIERALTSLSVASQLVHVENGESALDYLHHRKGFTDLKDAPRPRLILLDLRLPRLHGLEVLKEIKSSSSLRSIPVVVLTTSEAESDISSAYRHRANSYLRKPLDFNSFTQMLDQVARYWLGWNLFSDTIN